MTKAGDSILRGARQALAYARGAREGFVAHAPNQPTAEHVAISDDDHQDTVAEQHNAHDET